MKSANNEIIAGKVKQITRGGKVEVTKKLGGKTIRTLKESILQLIEEGYGEICIPGLVTFKTVVKEEHIARNPKTQEEVVVPTRLRTVCKLSNAFKDKVKELDMKNIAIEEEKDEFENAKNANAEAEAVEDVEDTEEAAE